MDRRTFIGSVGGGLLAAPLAARAQKSLIPVIGYVGSTSPATSNPHALAGFQAGLAETGYVEGKNVAIEFRWAEGHYDRLPALAADLVRQQVAVVVADGGPRPALAAKAATSTIPIVFVGVDDPVRHGLVVSIDRPGGNATGVTIIALGLITKRLELLHEVVPNTTTIASLVNPDTVGVEWLERDTYERGRSLGLEVHVLRARTEREIDAAFATIVQLRAGALIVGANTFFYVQRDKVIRLAARHALPALYPLSGFVTDGGLMSYDADVPEALRQAGILTGKILHGAKPAEMPIHQSTKLELVINLKTAKALGLTIPQSLLLRADKLIQ